MAIIFNEMMTKFKSQSLLDSGKGQKVKESGKTIIFSVRYLGQCGSGYGEKVIRKIELKETQTLDDLHEAIIYKSFKWFDPHLYSFHFDNNPRSRNKNMEYTCDLETYKFPYNLFIQGKPNSTKAKLGKLNLKKKQKFLFVFDFGDDHRFSIKVTGFGNVQKGKKYPLILEEKGKAPEQYPEA